MSELHAGGVKQYKVLPVNKGGRPSRIDEPCTDAVGNPSTVAEGIVSRMRAGSYLETAAAACGVPNTTVQGWMRTGREAWTKVESGHTAERDLRAHEGRCLEFLRAIEIAEAEWLVRAEASLEKIVRGGQKLTRTTIRYDSNDNVIEKIVVTEDHPVDPRVIQWRLERRRPDLYGRRTAVEHALAAAQQDDAPAEGSVDSDSILDKLLAAGNAGVLDVGEAPPVPELEPVNGTVAE